MEAFENAVNFLNDLVWAQPSVFPLMIAVLLGYGIFITIRLGFVQLRKFGHGVKVVMGYYDSEDDTGDVNHFQALTTALSATVGIGNIAGVAIAIHYGGPGALVWMWLTAFLGMAVKYSECTLAVKYRKINDDGSVSGGPMYYIEKGLGPNWKWLATGFAGLAVICSFLTGNAVQANTMSDVMAAEFSIPVWITGVVSALTVAFVIIGGIKRIGNVTARLMPLMAAIYILGALIILFVNYDQVIPAFGTILKSAFTPKAGLFGAGTGAFMVTMIWGIKRGLFSNEAGQGSAPIAHGAAKTEEPVREGVVALLEPFIDTIVVCTMTGLVIVTTGVWDMQHAATMAYSDSEYEYVADDDSNILLVENGKVLNGSIVRNDGEVAKLYTDEAQTVLYSGSIELEEEGVVFFDSSSEEVEVLYTSTLENGAPLTTLAFQKGLSPIFGGGGYIVAICVLLFGISTSISWSYYGDRSIQYLAGDKSIIYYKVVYIFMHFVGAVLTLETVWAIGDIALGLMTFPNLIGLFALSGIVAASSKTYFNKMKEIES